MLALSTGWTPDVLADLPQRFRGACHWALYVRSLIGPEGLPAVEVPKGASPEARMAAAKLRVEVDKVRTILFPEDDDGDA